MTIKVYMEKAHAADKGLTPVGHTKPWAEAMEESTDIWSNEACMGYAVKAMEYLNMERDAISEVLTRMGWAFSDMTVDEAAQHYCDF